MRTNDNENSIIETHIHNGPTSMQTPKSQIMIGNDSDSFESSISACQDLTFNTAERIFSESDIMFDDEKAIIGFYKDGLYTNLAYMISDQCTYGIKIAVFSDHQRTEILERTEIVGSVLSQPLDVMRFLRPYNKLRSTISDLIRTDWRTYPESSLRETVINAIVHRDYSLDVDTLISVFPDAISVSSYGGLKAGLETDDIIMGISSPRNQRMASIFQKLGFMNTLGTGIPCIMGDYRNNLLRPSIELSTNVFKIVLPMRKETATDQTSVDMIMGYARKHGHFTRAEIERVTGDSRSKVGMMLSSMVDEGLIERTGNGRSTSYRICSRL